MFYSRLLISVLAILTLCSAKFVSADKKKRLSGPLYLRPIAPFPTASEQVVPVTGYAPHPAPVPSVPVIPAAEIPAVSLAPLAQPLPAAVPPTPILPALPSLPPVIAPPFPPPSVVAPPLSPSNVAVPPAPPLLPLPPSNVAVPSAPPLLPLPPPNAPAVVSLPRPAVVPPPVVAPPTVPIAPAAAVVTQTRTIGIGMCPGGDSLSIPCDPKRPWPQCPPQSYCYASNSVDIGPYYCCPVWSTYGAQWRPQRPFYPYYPPMPHNWPGIIKANAGWPSQVVPGAFYTGLAVPWTKVKLLLDRKCQAMFS